MSKPRKPRKPAPEKRNRPPEAALNGPAPLSRGKIWLFRLVASVGLPLLLLSAVEITLSWTGSGYPTAFFVRQQINGQECWIENNRFGLRFFPKVLARTPCSFAIPVKKPANTVRIFVLGESAAQGDPQPMFGFSRMLRYLLQERFPSRRFEVVNAAMTAINSHVILPIARDCAQREGDLWIIYMGNNEVVGPFGAGTVFGGKALPLPLIRASLALQTTKTGQFLDNMAEHLRSASQPPQYWKGMELMAQQQVRQDDRRMPQLYANFGRNLHDILQTGTQAGVPIVLCSVAVNLKDSPPFGTLHRPDLTADESGKWQRAYAAGLASQAQGNWTGALSQFLEAEKDDSHFAELQFRLGQVLLELGREAESKEHFQRALDEDSLRFRADTVINRRIREAAQAWRDQGVRLLDVEQLFAQHSSNRISGDSLFYEHVHLTPEGNYLLARAAAEEAAACLGLTNGSPAARQKVWPSQKECEAGIGLTEWNRSRTVRMIVDRMGLPPFPGTVNHTNRLNRVQLEVNRLRASGSPAAAKIQAAQVLEAVSHHPDDWELRETAGVLLSLAQEMPRAIEQLQAAIRLMPQAPSPTFSLAGILALQGRHDDSIRLYRECLRFVPDSFEVLIRIGIVELGQRRFPEAIQDFREAIKSKPDSVAARIRLGAALLQTGDKKAARGQFQEVIKLEPENTEAQEFLRRTE